jgi:hypothetical protein
MMRSASNTETNPVRPEFVNFHVRGGWCWFQDERAIIDAGKIVVGSVAPPLGDVNVTTYEVASGRAVTVPLHERLQSDDHDAPALLKLGDGRYLAAYTSHDADNLMRWRVSLEPGDATRWGPENTLDVGDRVTYANLCRLSAENDGRGRIYNLHRGVGFNPNYLVSDDDGRTFRYGGRLLDWPRDPARRGSGRPYVRYACDGVETIHFITTEDHPRHFDNGIYHGFIRGGGVHRSDGTDVGQLGTTKRTSLKPTDLTCVFRGDARNVAWTVDLRLDSTAKPYAAFSVRDEAKRLHYHHARWDGRAWRANRMAHAGTALYAAEGDYSGLVALDPSDASAAYISTNADPHTGARLPHWEIYNGVTRDGGASWSWSALTRDSAHDNIRPIARPVDRDRTVVLWLRGTYRSYTDYELDVVGTFLPR